MSKSKKKEAEKASKQAKTETGTKDFKHAKKDAWLKAQKEDAETSADQMDEEVSDGGELLTQMEEHTFIQTGKKRKAAEIPDPGPSSSPPPGPEPVKKKRKENLKAPEEPPKRTLKTNLAKPKVDAIVLDKKNKRDPSPPPAKKRKSPPVDKKRESPPAKKQKSPPKKQKSPPPRRSPRKTASQSQGDEDEPVTKDRFLAKAEWKGKMGSESDEEETEKPEADEPTDDGKDDNFVPTYDAQQASEDEDEKQPAEEDEDVDKSASVTSPSHSESSSSSSSSSSSDRTHEYENSHSSGSSDEEEGMYLKRVHGKHLKYMPIKTPYQLVKRKTPQKRVRVQWTEEEDVSLKRGVKRYGVGQWAVIFRRFSEVWHEKRTPVSLKDRWRVLVLNQVVSV